MLKIYLLTDPLIGFLVSRYTDKRGWVSTIQNIPVQGYASWTHASVCGRGDSKWGANTYYILEIVIQTQVFN